MLNGYGLYLGDVLLANQLEVLWDDRKRTKRDGLIVHYMMHILWGLLFWKLWVMYMCLSGERAVLGLLKKQQYMFLWDRPRFMRSNFCSIFVLLYQNKYYLKRRYRGISSSYVWLIS